MVVRGRGACQETGRGVAQAATVRNGTAKGLAMDMGHGLEPGRSFRIDVYVYVYVKLHGPIRGAIRVWLHGLWL